MIFFSISCLSFTQEPKSPILFLKNPLLSEAQISHQKKNFALIWGVSKNKIQAQKAIKQLSTRKLPKFNISKLNCSQEYHASIQYIIMKKKKALQRYHYWLCTASLTR